MYVENKPVNKRRAAVVRRGESPARVPAFVAAAVVMLGILVGLTTIWLTKVKEFERGREGGPAFLVCGQESTGQMPKKYQIGRARADCPKSNRFGRGSKSHHLDVAGVATSTSQLPNTLVRLFLPPIYD